MEALIWIGAAMALLGLIGVVWAIVKVAKARSAGLSDEELRAAVQAAMPLNMGALVLSVLGLMTIILGISFS